MRITESKLKRIIRKVLQESTFSRNASVPQADILYLRNLITSYMGTFGDWDGFCDWYDSLMEDLQGEYGQEMIVFLRQFGLQTCPPTNRDLVNAIMDPRMQEEPMYATWTRELRFNF